MHVPRFTSSETELLAKARFNIGAHTPLSKIYECYLCTYEGCKFLLEKIVPSTLIVILFELRNSLLVPCMTNTKPKHYNGPTEYTRTLHRIYSFNKDMECYAFPGIW